MKRIVGGYKDENGIFIKESETIDFSLDGFLEKYLLILHRETKNLLEESKIGKLDKDSSQCVRDNLKLIMELKKQEKAVLDNLTDEELKKLAKKYEE